jgi:hypothetical protein
MTDVNIYIDGTGRAAKRPGHKDKITTYTGGFVTVPNGKPHTAANTFTFWYRPIGTVYVGIIVPGNQVAQLVPPGAGLKATSGSNTGSLPAASTPCAGDYVLLLCDDATLEDVIAASPPFNLT